MTGNAKELVDITREIIGTLTETLTLYDKALDEVIPWKTYEDSMKELNTYTKDYSLESAELVGDVRKLLMDAQDQYFVATITVGAWCGLARKLLKLYLKLLARNDTKTLDAQKKTLIYVLDNGATQMKEASLHIIECSNAFNGAKQELISLIARLEIEFDSKSEFFNNAVDKIRKEAYGGAAVGAILGLFGLLISYPIAAGITEGKLVPELEKKFQKVKNYFNNLKVIVENTIDGIESTKQKLTDEWQGITDLKEATESTRFHVTLDELDEIREEIEESVNDLISLCDDYRKRHGLNKYF